MSLDSATPVVLALTMVAGTALLLAGCWDRLRTLSRSGLAIVALLSVLATVALQINRMTEAFPTTAPAAAGPGSGGGSRVVQVTVAGTASHLALQMYVYLPAAYRPAARGSR